MEMDAVRLKPLCERITEPARESALAAGWVASSGFIE
jgi:hypothetical protein